MATTAYAKFTLTTCQNVTKAELSYSHSDLCSAINFRVFPGWLEMARVTRPDLDKQGYRYHKLRKTFSKFYRRYYYLISKFQVGLKSLLRQGLLEPDFYGGLVY